MGQKCVRLFRHREYSLPAQDFSIEKAPEHPSASPYGRHNSNRLGKGEARGGLIDRNALKTEDDRKTIIQALNNHFFFTSLTEEDQEMVVENMQLLVMDTGLTVFEQDRPSKSYFVVRTGQLEVLKDGKKINAIYVGQGFGEMALQKDEPRPATVRCIDPTTLWFIDRDTFRDYLGLARVCDDFWRMVEAQRIVELIRYNGTGQYTSIWGPRVRRGSSRAPQRLSLQQRSSRWNHRPQRPENRRRPSSKF